MPNKRPRFRFLSVAEFEQLPIDKKIAYLEAAEEERRRTKSPRSSVFSDGERADQRDQ
jgi:hypothetical protein